MVLPTVPMSGLTKGGSTGTRPHFTTSSRERASDTGFLLDFVAPRGGASEFISLPQGSLRNKLDLSNHHLSVCICPPTHPSVCPSHLSIVLPSTNLPTYLPIHPSITCLSNLYLAVCLILLCVFFKVLCMYYSLLNYRVILNVTVIIQCCSPAALVPYIKLGHSSVGSLFPFSHWLVHTRVETVLLKLDSCIKENVHWSFSH